MKKGTYVATDITKKRMSKAAQKAWEKRRLKAAEPHKKVLNNIDIETFSGFDSKAISSEPNWKMIALELMKKYQ